MDQHAAKETSNRSHVLPDKVDVLEKVVEGLKVKVENAVRGVREL
jgi:hypothetical protein